MKFGLTAVLVGSALPNLDAQELIPWNATWKYSIDMGDQGTAWRDIAFNDTAWPSGVGPLGFPANESVVPNVAPQPFPAGSTIASVGGTAFAANPNSAGNRTTYYRTRFMFNGNPQQIMLQMEGLLDDGAIIYLNGEQVVIFGNAPAPPVDYTSLFTPDRGDVSTRAMDVMTLGGGDLLVGENVLAMEVHQSSDGSSDIVAGLHLTSFFGPVITDNTLPADTNVVQNRSATLEVRVAGAPLPTYQWFFNPGGGAGPILDATNSTYTIVNMSATQAGTYFCRATGNAGSVDSRTATVGFTADFTAPSIQRARWADDLSVFVQFDEILDVSAGAGTIDPFGFHIIPESGTTLTVGSVTPANNNTALILTNLTISGAPVSRDPTKNYELLIDDSYVSDPAGNFISPDVTVDIASPLIVLPWNAEWRYLQDGSDQGTAWVAPGFNDSSWSTGLGVLGQDDGYAARGFAPMLTDLMAPNEGGPITIYFRTKFFLPNVLADILELSLLHVRDDGAVVHLNGVEVVRGNVPAGQNSATAGTDHEADHIDGPAALPGFVAGENTLAVEVHNVNATSSDIVWGAQLTALLAKLPTGPPVVGDHPDPVMVPEGGTAVFSVVASGALPLSYQWQRNNVNLMDQTNSVLTLNNVMPPQAGNYRCVVTNPAGTANSDAALLTVVADGIRPTLVSALGSADLATVALTFSEGMDPTSSQLAGNYNVRVRGGGAPVGVSTAVLTNGTNVILTTTAPRSATMNYEVVVTGVADDAFGLNVINPNPTTANIIATISLVAINDAQMWRYDQTDVFPGPTWLTPAYVDTAWLQGAALLAVETATLAFPVRTPLFLAITNEQAMTTNFITTYYFRTHFNFSGNPAAADVIITPVVDDGAIFYLNGTEIHRVGITNDPVAHLDLASRTVGDAAPEPVNLGVLPELLAGDNVIAVEVHQSALGSSDIVMGVQLDAQVLTLGPGAPSLFIRRLANGNVEISWTADTSWVLVESTTAKGTYTPVAGSPTSPVIIPPPPPGPAKYYQLRQ